MTEDGKAPVWWETIPPARLADWMPRWSDRSVDLEYTPEYQAVVEGIVQAHLKKKGDSSE